MQKEEVIQLIKNEISAQHIDIDMNGNHYDVLVVSETFEGLSAVKKQQMIYACITEKIASGEIHAVNIRALTPDEWQG